MRPGSVSFHQHLFRTSLTHEFPFSGAICDEAVKVFSLNEGLFSVLRPPTGNKALPTVPSEPPLGNPSPIQTPPTNGSSQSDQKWTTNIPYYPLQALDGSDRPPETDEEGSYGISSVLTILLAIAAAHFALTTGGFTGAKGFAKLEAVQDWVGERFSSLFG